LPPFCTTAHYVPSPCGAARYIIYYGLDAAFGSSTSSSGDAILWRLRLPVLQSCYSWHISFRFLKYAVFAFVLRARAQNNMTQRRLLPSYAMASAAFELLRFGDTAATGSIYAV